MKLGLIIQDLSRKELDELLAKLEGESTSVIQEEYDDSEETETVSSGGVEVDSDGLPWDARIHSGKKTKNSDGRWKRRKGVQDVEYNAIVAELKGDDEDDGVPAFAKPTPSPAPIAAKPMPAPVATVVPKRDFQGLMTKISSLFREQKIDPTYPPSIVNRINNDFGVKIATITDIANDSNMVEYAWQCLEVDGKVA